MEFGGGNITIFIEGPQKTRFQSRWTGVLWGLGWKSEPSQPFSVTTYKKLVGFFFFFFMDGEWYRGRVGKIMA